MICHPNIDKILALTKTIEKEYGVDMKWFIFAGTVLSFKFDLFIYRIWFKRWNNRIAQDEVLRHTLLGWLLSHEHQYQQMQSTPPSILVH